MGFSLAAFVGIALAAILLIAKESITQIYTDNANVAAVAGAVLVWVAAYHAADAVQTLCVFVLRCYRITLAPLVVYCALLWGAGLAGGYWLAYGGSGPWSGAASPTPFWAASAAALAVTALLFAAMLWRAISPAAQNHASGSQGK